MDRKGELEKKRQRLLALRRDREERKAAIAKAASTPCKEGGSKDIDDLVNDLIGDQHLPLSAGDSRSSNEVACPIIQGGSLAKTDKQLKHLEFTSLDLAPRGRIVYNKEIQTASPWSEEIKPSNQESGNKTSNGAQSPIATKNGVEQDAAGMAQAVEVCPRSNSPEALPPEELRAVVESDRFRNFFEHSSKLVERALNVADRYDFTVDYAQTAEPSGDERDAVVVMNVFESEKWTLGRAVTDLMWSPKHSELCLAAYNKTQLPVNECDGIVLVWNEFLKGRPEYTFMAQSDVLSAVWAPFHPNLIVGGTYSGQILLWDTRSKSAYAVAETPLSVSGHTHPVHDLTIVGAQNTHNLVTVSSDGLVCTWQLDMLNQPKEVLELLYPTSTKMDEVAATCIDFPNNETTTFWTGTEEGKIFKVNRYNRANMNKGIDTTETYEGHHALVSALQFHAAGGSAEYADIFLTASFDWTVKLWRATRGGAGPSTPQESVVIKPLHSFEEFPDYVYDVKWSPVHPAVFACVDGSGRLSVWNINLESDVPLASINAGEGKALNKLSWDREGKRIAVGTSEGEVAVVDASEFSRPREDEWHMLARTLLDLEFQSAENTLNGH